MASNPPTARLAAGVFGLLLLSAWLLMHLYWGIAHDAVLYTMQGLAHLRPDLYAHDISMRYGSQEKFTIFGVVYAPLIGLVGVDHAGAVFTVLSQLGFFFAAWLLARSLMPNPMALLGVALLAVLEAPYGSHGVFHLVEDFITPRLMAEALVLTGIWCFIRQRHLAAYAGCLMAAAFHPLMACGGFVLLIGLQIVPRWPRTASLTVMALIALLPIVAHSALGASLRIDDIRFDLVLHTPYLLLAQWSQVDLSTTAVPLMTLILAALLPWSPMTRSLALAALATTIAGLLLTAIGADWLRLSLIIQVQPWRWDWIAVALATIFLPIVGARLWNIGPLGRATLALMISAYEFQDVIYGFEIALLTIGSAVLAMRCSASLARRQQRLVLTGAIALLLIALTWDIANRAIFAQIPFINFAGMPWVGIYRRLAHGSLLPGIAITAAWCWVFGPSTRQQLRIALALAALACALIVPDALKRWSRVLYPPAVYQAFAGWRAHIAPGAEVLMARSPLVTWVILERPSYVSQPQQSTGLFSRQASMHIRQRIESLATFLRQDGARELIASMNVPDVPVTLTQICHDSDVQYVVTRSDLKATPIEIAPVDVPLDYRGFKLYQCGA